MHAKSMTVAAEQAAGEVARGRYLAAKERYEKALTQTSDLAEKAVLSYNLGQLYWLHVGDGVHARENWQSAVEFCEAARDAGEGEGSLAELETNACGNLMLLSLSYEEHDTWWKRLDSLQADVQGLVQHHQWVEHMRETVHPWYEALLGTASQFYHPDPSQDRGLYPRAAAIFQLVLTHRRQLRVARQEFGRVVGGYAEQIMRTVALCEQAMHRARSGVDHGEFEFILRDAVRLVEECATAIPSDPQIQEHYQKLEEALDMVTEGGPASSASAGSRRLEADIEPGKIIAQNFIVKAVRSGQVPQAIASYVGDATILELDARYENHSRLSIYGLSNRLPPPEQWPLIAPENFRNISVKKTWVPSDLGAPSIAMAYKAQTSAGSKVALINMMTATEDTLVLATVSWYGVPPMNRFRVGFKPGMETRTQELLLAGKELSQRIRGHTA
jgi:tetratricopeptide (TPR) repeat protein